MTINLPSSIEAYFTTERDGSPEELAAVFTEDAIVQDSGENLMGHAAIRQWKVDYSKKFGPTVTEPFFITEENGRTLVTAHVSGDFPGSPIDLRYFFVVSGDKIAALEITV